MQIYITLPGGELKGPFTREEINRDLAARKYKDTDYWAWYTGQTEWVPLHSVPGVVGSDDTAAWTLEQSAQDGAPAPVQPQASEPKPPSTETSTVAFAASAEPHETAAASDAGAASRGSPGAASAAASPAPPPEPTGAPAPLERKLFSGLPFTALAHVFILTTGEGPAASRSAVTTRMLEDTVGETLAAIRERAPRDVVARCAFMEQLRTQAALPTAAWSAMANFNTQLVQDARAGLYKVVVRTFPIESGDLVCLFVYYNQPNSGKECELTGLRRVTS